MRRAEVVCVALGALLISVGAGAVYWPAGLIVAGVLLVAVVLLPGASA